MLKKILFQAHWVVGITAGIFLAFSGVTGALMAFDKEITALLRTPPHVTAQGTPLPPDQLLAKIQEARPEARVAALSIQSDPTAAAVVSFMAAREEHGDAQGMGGGMAAGMGGGMGAGMSGGMEAGMEAGHEGGADTQYVDPYTGAFLPANGQGAAAFFATIKRLHRGVWAGRDTTPGLIMQGIMAYSAFMLILMVPTGLYLRWPRGIAARKWQTWFKVNFRLKGPAFLFSLHAVLGTLVMVVYLLFAHTGMMRSHAVDWYSNGARSLTAIGRGPSSDDVVATEEGASGRRQEAMQYKPVAMNANVGSAWAAFTAAVPTFQAVTLSMSAAAEASPVLRVVYQSKDSGALAALAFDSSSGVAANDPDGELSMLAGPAEARPGKVEYAGQRDGFLRSFIGGAEIVHTGRYWGIPGQIVMFLAAIAMPVLLISGYMMYLSRRRRGKTWTTRGKSG